MPISYLDSLVAKVEKYTCNPIGYPSVILLLVATESKSKFHEEPQSPIGLNPSNPGLAELF
jgi:hypothetical protein